MHDAGLEGAGTCACLSLLLPFRKLPAVPCKVDLQNQRNRQQHIRHATRLARLDASCSLVLEVYEASKLVQAGANGSCKPDLTFHSISPPILEIVTSTSIFDKLFQDCLNTPRHVTL
jgi:hypothetical protein